MSILSDSTPLSQDTDAAIVAMLNEMLAQDNLAIIRTIDGYHVVEYTSETKELWSTIDIYETRAAAYRGAIDCLIEACVFAWDQGDEK